MCVRVSAGVWGCGQSLFGGKEVWSEFLLGREGVIIVYGFKNSFVPFSCFPLSFFGHDILSLLTYIVHISVFAVF